MLNEEKINPNGKVVIPVNHLPIFRSTIAIQNNVQNKLLFRTWGGLGDQICAEPTLRYALKNFKHSDIYLSSEHPDIFSHLNFKQVFDERKNRPIYSDYFVFETITPPDDTNLVWQFFSHMLTNCVDFPSLCALRSQLPISEKEIFLTGKKPKDYSIGDFKNAVFVHAGRHWPSKTFPKDWWDDTIREITRRDLQVILLGAQTDDNRGTVDVDTSSCLDLRNKLSIQESIWLLQRAKVLLTNDSSPLHMAASTDPREKTTTGLCEIQFIATCKHPDYISHWRKGKWQYRETNLGLGGIWDIIDHCPNKDQKITVDQIDEKILRTWLPDSKSVADGIKYCHENFWVN